MAEDASIEEPVDLRKDIPAVAFMAMLFLASIGLSMLFSLTFQQQNIRAFEDPDSLANPLIYLGVVVVFTIGILLIAKFGRRVLIKYVILGSILMTIYYVAWPLLVSVMGAGDPVGPSELVAGVVSVGLTALLWFYPEWYVIDAVGIVVAAGAAGIFGISFGLLPCLILLTAFAVYDAIAVYRTKHMLALADSVLELRLPIMFVVPKTRGYSFLEETRQLSEPKTAAPAAGAPAIMVTKELRADGFEMRVTVGNIAAPDRTTIWLTRPDGTRESMGVVGAEALSVQVPRDAIGVYTVEAREYDNVVATATERVEKRREAMFMGLGDAVIPAVLVVSAMTFLAPTAFPVGKIPAYIADAPMVAGITPLFFVALATLAGSFAGFLALMYFVL
ncbi:MAG: presenilin family intramembrane aspartyl protease PSH, partial [Candidatus Thermoplasmatota archaeon]